ncbi:MAG: hypothetical protein HY062_03965 [Bacteroidetes bacterium]|nr:hypothetical protein [Bacteroidota bacterium]
MKISVVIPSNNEAIYVEELIAYIKSTTQSENIEEIIIVESFDKRHIIKVAEKSHAKLYYNLLSDKIVQMEMGAFQAVGEVIYFIKPGCIPPSGFDIRILKHIQEKYSMGCFDFETSESDNIFKIMYKKLCGLLCKDFFQANSFFVLNKLYYQVGGLKKNNNYIKLKKQVLLNGNQIYY